MLSKKVEDLEIAILEKKHDRALAVLVEIMGVVVALRADSPAPLIRWRSRPVPGLRLPRKRTENDLICDAIRIAALASSRVPRATGEMICPKCGRKLVWNIHDTGRVWGICESDDCMSFME